MTSDGLRSTFFSQRFSDLLRKRSALGYPIMSSKILSLVKLVSLVAKLVKFRQNLVHFSRTQFSPLDLTNSDGNDQLGQKYILLIFKEKKCLLSWNGINKINNKQNFPRNLNLHFLT